MSRQPEDVRRARILLAVLFVVCGAYELRRAVEGFRFLSRADTSVASLFAFDNFTRTLGRVGPEAAQAGLQKGDVVQALDGVPFRGFAQLAALEASRRPGDVVQVTVLRPGETVPRTHGVTLAPLYPRGLGAVDWILLLVVGVLTPWACLLLGFWVAGARPHDGNAWRLLFLMLCFSQLSSLDFVELAAWGPFWGTLASGYSRVLGHLWPVGMVLMAVAFPDRLPADRRWPFLKWLLIAPLIAHALQMSLRDAVAVVDLDRASVVRGLMSGANKARFFLIMLSIGSFFAALGYRRGRTTSPDDRRRLSLLLWGCNLSLTPLGTLFTYIFFSQKPLSAVSPWALVPVLLLLFLFPVTLAYVIVVERALDVRVVVRQGLQYALARKGILAAQMVLSAVIIFVSASWATQRGSRPLVIQTIAGGIALVFALRVAADALGKFTDRRFFREAYDAEKILGELAESVRTMVEAGPLLETVTRTMSESLHIPRIAALVREGEGFTPARAVGLEEPGLLPRVPAESALAERLSGQQPLRIYLDDPTAWFNAKGRENERERLAALGAELLLPLAVKDRLLGFLALGPKQSEAPYSSSDLRLLQSVAAQTALALENSRLTAAVASEVALRARMSREVEIAREVQERLFPQNRPQVPGLDYAGACRPALGVGGDYFDFLELPEGRFGLAIGDVSGKGISAALLMASLQASLRGQSLAGSQDLSLLMGNVNQLIYEASQANRYATFFYGTYDPADRRLRYVNAGHNAPMLLRAHGNGGAQLERLDRGGPVIGLLFPVPYEEASVVLAPGDVLVAYTDGISEAMNGADEEWGEERLGAVAATLRDADAERIVSGVFAAADAFVAGAKQHDDMTLVVARVLSSGPAGS